MYLFNKGNKNNVFYSTFLGGYTGAQVRESASSSSSSTPSGNRRVGTTTTSKTRTTTSSTSTSKTTTSSTSNKSYGTALGGGSTVPKETLNRTTSSSNPSLNRSVRTTRTPTTSTSSSSKTTTTYSNSNKSYGTFLGGGSTVPKETLNRTTSSLNNPNVAGAATVSSIEEYLQKTNPTIINTAPDSFSPRINNNRNNVINDTYNFESNNPKDLKSFIYSVTDNTPYRYINGKKYYIVDSKTAGTLSVGPSIVLKYNSEHFEKYGVDVSTLKEGSIISAEIVDKVTNDILNDKKQYVLDVLDKNGITGLTSSQIDALTSRAYSVGNISDFPSEYKKYGNTNELYDNYLNTVTAKGTEYEESLVKRRNAEIELFKNGYKEVDNNNNTNTNNDTISAPDIRDPMADYIDELKTKGIDAKDITDSSRPTGVIRDPMADHIDELKSKGIDVKDITDSSRPTGVIRDPIADYIDELKSKGIDVKDITDSSRPIDVTRNVDYGKTPPNDLYSFIRFLEGNTGYSDDKGSYVISDTLDGVPTVGPGVTLNNYTAKLFQNHGVDISGMTVGDTIPVDIVNEVKREIEIEKRQYVINLLEKNNINDLTPNQIDALTSRAYNIGNVDGFPEAYKKYGNTEALYDNYMSTVIDEGSDHEEGLRNRRKYEWDLFKNGYII